LTALSVNPADAKTSTSIPIADAKSIPEYEATKIQEPSQDNNKPSKPKTKGWIGSLYVESIMINGKPKFLCNSQGKIIVKNQLEFEDEAIRPLDAEECGYYPYSFVGKEDEIVAYCNKEITTENILDEIKEQIDHFVVAPIEATTTVQGDLLVTYCQEWMSTVHFPFFVGETESGKSTGLHLARWLGYRCLYGEDIPSADIYNFLGMDEEGAGMIAEDEAQDIWRNHEKINMYKNSYSKGSKKSRIVGVDSLKKRQVHYNTYCPKWFAGEQVPGNKGFLERLAIIYMVEGEPMGNIKRPTDEEVDQLHRLRNKLLVWKLQNIGKPTCTIDSELKGRDQELWEDFQSLAIDTKYEDTFRDTVRYYTQQRQNKIKNSIEAKLFSLVCNKITPDLELKFRDFWEYLTNSSNSEISGKLNDNRASTFYADDYAQKITHQSLAKLFEYKFQAAKVILKTRDSQQIQHQTTVYRFKKNIMQKLIKKYGTELPIDHPLYVRELGEHGEHGDDQVDLVDQVGKKAKNYRCQDCNTEFLEFLDTLESIQAAHAKGTHKIEEILKNEVEN